MKQSLQLKVSQSLTMTPQLQQAIRLLQLSSLDLQQEIQSTLESNPLLELEEEVRAAEAAEKPAEVDNAPAEESPTAAVTATEDTPTDTAIADDSSWDDALPENTTLDNRWEESFTVKGPGSGEGDYSIDARNAITESLRDHLRWQLNLCRLSETDHAIGLALIDGIDDDGRLTEPLEDIVDSFDDASEVEPDEVLAMLHRIQQFDPPGVGFRDLRECLLIQLRQLPETTPFRAEALHLVGEHIDDMAGNDYQQLQKKTRLGQDALKGAIELIRTLTPCPGEMVSPLDPEYVVPDVFVNKINGRWQVQLNPDTAPKIRINERYASLARQCESASDNQFIRDNLQEARWFLKSLQSRNDTLERVAAKIVEVQQGFFEHGDEAMRPLVLHDIAEAVELHESTISRVTTQKFMHTPRGVFELKYFFSSHVSTESGGEFSSTAIRALIKKLVAAENPRKPLSDNKIAGILDAEGIKVARRTIAKYRESLAIPPSSERKRLV